MIKSITFVANEKTTTFDTRGPCYLEDIDLSSLSISSVTLPNTLSNGQRTISRNYGARTITCGLAIDSYRATKGRYFEDFFTEFFQELGKEEFDLQIETTRRERYVIKCHLSEIPKIERSSVPRILRATLNLICDDPFLFRMDYDEYTTKFPCRLSIAGYADSSGNISQDNTIYSFTRSSDEYFQRINLPGLPITLKFNEIPFYNVLKINQMCYGSQEEFRKIQRKLRFNSWQHTFFDGTTGITEDNAESVYYNMEIDADSGKVTISCYWVDSDEYIENSTRDITGYVDYVNSDDISYFVMNHDTEYFQFINFPTLGLGDSAKARAYYEHRILSIY